MPTDNAPPPPGFDPTAVAPRSAAVLLGAALLGLPVVSIAAALGAAPASAGESAAAILARLHQLDTGPRTWVDRRQRVKLHIVDRSGKERVREIESYSKRYGGGEEKALLFFLAPAELRNTGFLQWAHPDRDDEQWLYLSELKRTRQISARAKRESFVGTDFSYADLEILNELPRWTDKEAAAALKGDEDVDGHAAHVIVFTPRDREALGYDSIRLWLRANDLTMARVEFYGPEGVLKRLILDDFRTLGAIPTPHRLTMHTVATGGHTVIEVVSMRYDCSLSDDLFTQRALERGPE